MTYFVNSTIVEFLKFNLGNQVDLKKFSAYESCATPLFLIVVQRFSCCTTIRNRGVAQL